MSALQLTGPPGSGKTTALRRAVDRLGDWRLAGFYTEEIRERGACLGFRAVTLDGQVRDLARVEFRARRGSGATVDVEVIDWLAAMLSSRAPVDAWLVDEIGKMGPWTPRIWSLPSRQCMNASYCPVRNG